MDMVEWNRMCANRNSCPSFYHFVKDKQIPTIDERFKEEILRKAHFHSINALDPLMT